MVYKTSGPEVKNSICQALGETSLNDLFDIRPEEISRVSDYGKQMVVEPDIATYKKIELEKKYKMLGIGQAKVKRLMTKISRSGVQLALLYNLLLNIQSSYFCMFRYLGSRSRYSKAYAKAYDDALRKFMGKYQNEVDKIQVQCYKLQFDIQFSHILIVKISGVGQLVFGANLDDVVEAPIMNELPASIDINPVNNYTIIESAVMSDFSAEIYAKYSEMSTERKNAYDAFTSFSGLLGISVDSKKEFKERLNKIMITSRDMSYSIPLSYLYQQRMSISAPGVSLPNMAVQTSNEFICVRISLPSMDTANTVLRLIHSRLCKHSWYLWCEGRNIEGNCYVICHRFQLSDSREEYEAFETMVLSYIALSVADVINCRVIDLFPTVISVEDMYVPGYGPVLVNLEYGIECDYSSNKITTGDVYIDWLVSTHKLNSEVLEATDRKWIYTKYCERNTPLPVKNKQGIASPSPITTDSILYGSENSTGETPVAGECPPSLTLENILGGFESHTGESLVAKECPLSLTLENILGCPESHTKETPVTKECPSSLQLTLESILVAEEGNSDSVQNNSVASVLLPVGIENLTECHAGEESQDTPKSLVSSIVTNRGHMCCGKGIGKTEYYGIDSVVGNRLEHSLSKGDLLFSDNSPPAFNK